VDESLGALEPVLFQNPAEGKREREEA
jgi:hypothetical protein